VIKIYEGINDSYNGQDTKAFLSNSALEILVPAREIPFYDSEESKSPDHITYLSSVTILSHDICRNRSPQT